MHVQQPPRPGALVQIVDILRDDQQLARPFGIEPRQRRVSGVGLPLGELRPPRIVKGVHQRRIARERFRRADILNAMVFP